MAYLQISEVFTYLALSAFYLLSIALALLFLYVSTSLLSFLVFYLKESIHSSHRPPIASTIFHQLVYFSTLFDYFTSLFLKHKTFRLVRPSHCDIYTADPANIEYVLKTNFSNYNEGEFNHEIMKDLFGNGIFAVDGDKWRHQRKLASYEFSTKVLREFSTDVFLTKAAKLAKKIAEVAGSSNAVDMQAGPRICLGKDFAYKQMKIMAATLLHFFKFKLKNESMVATYKTMFTLQMDKGLPIIPLPRFC